MNWTEGNLARHSRGKTAKNEVLKLQKQHFVKARSRLMNGGTRQSPISISFLNSPIARQPPIHVGSPEHGEPYSSEDQHHSPSTRVGFKVNHGQQPLHDQFEEHHHHDPFVAKPKVIRDEPSANRTARKAEATPGRASREKRRKLLDRADWAGLTMQQPLELTFPGQMRAGRVWSNTDHTEQGTAGKSRVFVRERPVNRAKPLRYKDGDKRLQPAIQRIKVQVGSQDTYIGNGSSPPSTRRRPAGSDRGNSTEISTVASESSHGSSCRDDWVRHCRKSSSRSADEHRMEWRDNSHRSARELRRPLEVTSSSNNSSESNAARVAYASLTLAQPAPLRADDFQVLRWSPSVSLDSGSLEVEVGQPTSRPDAMDIAENEKWKTLVDSSDHLIPLTRGSSLLNSPHVVPVLSPGISEMMVQSNEPGRVFTGSARIQDDGASTSRKPHRAMAANAMASGCDGDTREAQLPKSQAVFLVTNKPRDSKVQNDIDENMAWMKFVLDSDSDGFERYAMQEATRLAAREIRPSKSPEEISSTEASFKYSQSIRRSVNSPEVSADTSLASSDGVASATVTSASRNATHGSVYTSPSATNQHLETSTTCNSVDGTTPDDFPSSDGNNSVNKTVVSDVETTKATMATSEASETSKDTQQRHRFTAPQAFIGKHAQSDQSRYMQMLPPKFPETTKSNKRKGRRKKKALDGRTSIRELPNFDGDPIEDIEED
ncbi:hypothetical protein PG994_010953 [Apiospora phragmitis]|uniref:Uncharacterized protein n=1 Tax=Apiospora phragmitis TaxID=2905665 RepID=A0ABR1TRM5_9PEZI